jgi:succinyl-diaminopimelate desuccinylase
LQQAASSTASSTVNLARDLIRIESVTPNDNGCQDVLAERLEKIGFTVETMQFQDVSNLWAVRGEAKPLFVFAGHTDVVPTGPSEKWTFPPYSGTIDSDGYLHGRGAADMKGGVASFVVACERFVQKYPNHE